MTEPTRLLSCLLLLPLPVTMASGDSAFTHAFETALPRVVKLYGLGAGKQAGYGTGTIVSEDGLVLTIFSLLIDARHIRAVTSDGTVYGARLVHRDPLRQLALLKLHSAEKDDQDSESRPIGPFKFFDLNESAPLQAGDWILSVGNAFKVAEGAEPMSAAHGVFSARTFLDARRRLKDFPYRGEVLVIDAITSNPGAPGSAVVNLEGGFVGIVGRVVISNLTHTHFNYAIPRKVLLDYFKDATAGPNAKPRATLVGIDLKQLGLKFSGVGYRTVLPFVEHVRSDSRAARAGVRRDDLILAVNGRTVADLRVLKDRLRGQSSMEPIELVVRRGDRIINVQIAPEPPQ